MKQIYTLLLFCRAELLDLSKLRVEVQNSDADIARVHVGQALQVRADSLGQVLQGKVSYMRPRPLQQWAPSYLVPIDLDQQDVYARACQ
jgi:hypothetical protein